MDEAEGSEAEECQGRWGRWSGGILPWRQQQPKIKATRRRSGGRAEFQPATPRRKQQRQMHHYAHPHIPIPPPPRASSILPFHTCSDDQHSNMSQVVVSTQHASTSAHTLPYLPASSPSLWAELPSLPCSVEALSQKHKHMQEHPIALANLFDDDDGDDDDNATHQSRAGNGAQETTVGPSSPGDVPVATNSVDTEVRDPAPARDPFELFDVGSPWTQVNISTQWQRRLWLGKALGSDPSSDDRVDTAIDGSTEHQDRRDKQRNAPVAQPRQDKKKRRHSKTPTTVTRKEEQVVREVLVRRKKTRLAVELSDEDSDEDQSIQAGPSMPRRHPSPLSPELLSKAKVAPLQRPAGPVQSVHSPPRAAAAQTPRPRPKPRVSSVRAPEAAAQQPHAPLHATTDSEDDAPSATQFFTRKKRRRLSADYEVDKVEGHQALQRARTPMADNEVLLEPKTLGVVQDEDLDIAADIVDLASPARALVGPSEDQAELRTPEPPVVSPDVPVTHGFPMRALNDRTISFGQLSKDDEDALESFVEGMDSEDDEEGMSVPGGLASRAASAGDQRPQSPRRSRTPSNLTAAEGWLSASPSPPPPIEDYEDDDPSLPSGLAPLLGDLDEEKRRGYFAQFDSLLGCSAAGSRSLPRAGTTTTAWIDEREEDEGVGVEWPTTPSAGFGSAAAAARALGRAESDSRLLPNRFTGFSRPIVSCSQLLAADGDGNGDGFEPALDSPSTRRERSAGMHNKDSRDPRSNSNSNRADRTGLTARSRNAAGMGLVRKTWGSTWRDDGTRLVRGRVVRRASPPPAPAVLGAVDPRREREMWADEAGQAGQVGKGQSKSKSVAATGEMAGRTTRSKRKSGGGGTGSKA